MAQHSSRRDSHFLSSQHLSTTTLENRLHILREKSNALSQTLTQKLATSQSGQNLLHIGPSLSTLPPDLHSLEQNLAPLIQDVEEYDLACRKELSRIVQLGNQVRLTQRRSKQASECADMYHDLMASEALLKMDMSVKTIHTQGSRQTDQDLIASLDMTRLDVSFDKDGNDSDIHADIKEKNILEHLSSLERTAHITLYLIQELKRSTDPTYIQSTAVNEATTTASSLANLSLPNLVDPLPQATEKAQLLMKLSPRIRKLESQVVSSLVKRMEGILIEIGQQKELQLKEKEEGEEKENHDAQGLSNSAGFSSISYEIQEQEVR